jgi:hypothetical protein
VWPPGPLNPARPGLRHVVAGQLDAAAGFAQAEADESRVSQFLQPSAGTALEKSRSRSVQKRPIGHALTRLGEWAAHPAAFGLALL